MTLLHILHMQVLFLLIILRFEPCEQKCRCLVGVLQDVEASPFTFEAFNVLLGTCCMERYGLHGVNMELLTINE